MQKQRRKEGNLKKAAGARSFQCWEQEDTITEESKTSTRGSGESTREGSMGKSLNIEFVCLDPVRSWKSI